MIDEDALYEEYHIKVLRYIQSKVNDYYLAEDLCSDVFVKIYEKLDTFDNKKASISTWIFTITRNKLIDYYRTRKINVEIPENLAYEPEEKVDEDTLNALASALEKLDDRCKKLIVLHYYEDKSLKDIAKILGISYVYAKLLHKKALFILKNNIK